MVALTLKEHVMKHLKVSSLHQLDHETAVLVCEGIEIKTERHCNENRTTSNAFGGC